MPEKIVADSTAIADTTFAAVQPSENVGQSIMEHVTNSNEWHLPFLHVHLPHFEPINIMGIQIDLSITNHLVMMWLAGIIL